MERAEEEVPGAVAGEEASGTVSAVGSRREAEDHNARVRVPETGDRAAPVLFTGISSPFFAGYLLAPLYETRTTPAGGYLPFERREGRFFRLLVQAP